MDASDGAPSRKKQNMCWCVGHNEATFKQFDDTFGSMWLAAPPLLPPLSPSNVAYATFGVTAGRPAEGPKVEG